MKHEKSNGTMTTVSSIPDATELPAGRSFAVFSGSSDIEGMPDSARARTKTGKQSITLQSYRELFDKHVKMRTNLWRYATGTSLLTFLFLSMITFKMKKNIRNWILRDFMEELKNPAPSETELLKTEFQQLMTLTAGQNNKPS